jgi:glycosyltransferase involved in cell wall biosynthesis
MFEYLAAGLPVITTPFGARGLVSDKTGAIVQAEVEDFPRRILDVTADRASFALRSAAARNIAETQFDWTAISSEISRTLLAYA